jgi:hypothetical protein
VKPSPAPQGFGPVLWINPINLCHDDEQIELGTTGFFWDYTPGNKVGVCVEAVHPLRLRVDDRITGAVLWFTPRRRSHQGAEADQRHRGLTLNPGANMPPVGL